MHYVGLLGFLKVVAGGFESWSSLDICAWDTWYLSAIHHLDSWSHLLNSASETVSQRASNLAFYKMHESHCWRHIWGRTHICEACQLAPYLDLASASVMKNDRAAPARIITLHTLFWWIVVDSSLLVQNSETIVCWERGLWNAWSKNYTVHWGGSFKVTVLS